MVTIAICISTHTHTHTYIYIHSLHPGTVGYQLQSLKSNRISRGPGKREVSVEGRVRSVHWSNHADWAGLNRSVIKRCICIYKTVYVYTRRVCVDAQRMFLSISFSHASTTRLLWHVQPESVMLVHGEKLQMER